MTQEDFADLVGIRQGPISKLVRGLTDARGSTWAKIERATKGQVRMLDHYQEESGK